MLGANDSCWRTASQEEIYILFLGYVSYFAQGCLARDMRALELELCSAEGLRG